MTNKLGSMLRSFPEFRGKHRLSRWIFKNLIAEGRDISVKGYDDCEYILPNLKENLAFDIFINGIYEKETIDFLVRGIPPNATVLDIGANIGSICIPLAKKRKDIKIFCVEASPFVYHYLQQNIALNGLEGSISCFNKAITDADGAQLPFYSDPGNFGKGSLSPVFTKEAVMVEGITLDTLVKTLPIEKVDFIKIDIEGYEYFAFKGGRQLLTAEKKPAILLEFVDWAEEHAAVPPGSAQQLLTDYGYFLYTLDSMNFPRELKERITRGSAMLVAYRQPLN